MKLYQEPYSAFSRFLDHLTSHHIRALTTNQLSFHHFSQFNYPSALSASFSHLPMASGTFVAAAAIYFRKFFLLYRCSFLIHFVRLPSNATIATYARLDRVIAMTPMTATKTELKPKPYLQKQPQPQLQPQTQPQMQSEPQPQQQQQQPQQQKSKIVLP